MSVFLSGIERRQLPGCGLTHRIPSIDNDKLTRRLVDLPSIESRTRLHFKRAGLEGKVVGIEEFTLSGAADANSKNSLSMGREVGSKLEFVRGRAGFMPFMPGGIESTAAPATAEGGLSLHRDELGLFDVPPTFARGLQVASKAVSQDDMSALNKGLEDDEEEDDEDGENGLESREGEQSPVKDLDNELADGLETVSLSGGTSETTIIDELLPKDFSFGRSDATLTATQAGLTRVKEWAHVVDINKRIDNFDELVPNPARTYPFELDVFQKEAVYHLEQGDSVFVAAHTSAGKTVVAEYAISMAERNMTKAIYTSPIKALSNQKYRDFRQEYESVGILTGDVQINPEASCLIMTTEILRSMLYRGADLIRDVEFVIFDEVHYVNDQDRGVVWEEVIIMLPDHVKFILLSATVPNTFEFANWVGRTKQKDIYVISTPKRPVPLEHYLWAKNQTIKLVDENKNFLEDGYRATQKLLGGNKDDNATPSGGNQGGRGGGNAGRGGAGGRGGRGAPRGGNARGGGAPRGGAPRGGARSSSFRPGSGHNANLPGRQTLTQLCHHLQKHTLLPAVIFVFSKKRTEEYANMLKSLDYNTAKEKSEVRMFIDKAVARLKPDDRGLPQIMMIRDLLARGIGIHHGGLLPIMKEVIEILFAKSLVKVLFATETFAMGLNLPTRTVVFSGTRKNDGKNFRALLPGEYTQMAGRAGRRGLDTIGTVILMQNDPLLPPASSFKQMILGQPTKLQSQFRLTYNMILNLLRVEALKVEEMIKRSFSENATQVLLPEHEKTVKQQEAFLEKLQREPCAVCDQDIDKVHDAIVTYQRLTSDAYTLAMASPIGRRRIGIGRVIVFRKEGEHRHNIGIVSRFMRGASQGLQVILVGRETKPSKSKINFSFPFMPKVPVVARQLMKPFELRQKRFGVMTVDANEIDLITNMIIKENPLDISERNRDIVDNVITFLQKGLQHVDDWSELDFKSVKSSEILMLIKERDASLATIRSAKCFSCPTFKKSYQQVHEAYTVKQHIVALKQMISDQNLELLPDYEQRIEVLKDLNYVDSGLNVLLKGRVACEINSGFELIVTELVLDNFLGAYEPEEIVALLSCFVFEGNTKMTVESVTPHLDSGRARIHEIVRKTSDIIEKHQVQMTEDEATFSEKERFGLMEAVYEWARGMSFNDITNLTDVQEGTIVRVITRLDEVCREVASAARIIGDATLGDKMMLAQEKIKRDIVFCASLYL